MRRLWLCFLTLGLLAVLFAPAVAHRVNIFAFVDGGEIQVECGFRRGSSVQAGKIEVLDAATGAILLTGATDEQGIFRFPIPEAARETGHDLLIRVKAGEGHQNEWRISATDLGKPSGDEVDAVSTVRELQRAATVPAGSSREGQTLVLDRQELEKIINAALEQKLAPLRKMLAEQYNAEPSLRDIIGGIGWLLGLAGIALYFKSRRP